MKLTSYLCLCLTFCLWIIGNEGQEVKMDLDYENVTPKWKDFKQDLASRNKVKYKQVLDAFRDKLREFVKQHITENEIVKKNGISKHVHPQWLSFLADLGNKEAQEIGTNQTETLLESGQFGPSRELRQSASMSPAPQQGSSDAPKAAQSDTKEELGGGRKEGRLQRPAREAPGVMYLPVQSGSSSCPSYADTVASSLTQMAFASMAVTVFNAVANIANNINSNNRNDNINSNSNVDSNNANVASNNNNGNQVNVVLPPPIPGRKRQVDLKRKRRHILQLKRISGKLREMQGSRYALVEKLQKGSATGQEKVAGVKCMSRKAHAQAALATLSVVKSLLLSPGITSRGSGLETTHQEAQDMPLWGENIAQSHASASQLPPFAETEIRRHRFLQMNDPYNMTICSLQHLCNFIGPSALQRDLVSHVTKMGRLRDDIMPEGVSTGSATPLPVTCSSLKPLCPALP
ncbi:uncharacterized protein LOC125028871 [Penaeus chinensis]|uniref:uncharacterized protein LOC125028871 n=1 Tax=Penaeus chinensis TaxID=139456 RepID=UPI001FB57907|nr:uncharacterized protein LOC125028871 [Penaeus chinensis]